jgi:hypothetical protein
MIALPKPKRAFTPLQSLGRAIAWIRANECVGNVSSVSPGIGEGPVTIQFKSVEGLRDAFAGSGERLRKQTTEGWVYYSVDYDGLRFTADELAKRTMVEAGETVL